MVKKLFFLLGAALACLLAPGPALAGEPVVKFGTKVLVDAGWYQRSRELTSNLERDVTTTFADIPSHSPINFSFTSPDGRTGAFVEFGLKSIAGSASAGLRYAYGWYQVGELTLIAGQLSSWFGSPAFSPVDGQAVGSNQGNHIFLWGWGHLWGQRLPQVALRWQRGPWGLYFSLEEPQNRNIPAHAGLDFFNGLPRVTIAGKYGGKAINTMPAFNFTRHQAQGAAAGLDDSWDTWALVLPWKIALGALTILGQAHYGINFASEYLYYPADTGIVHDQDGRVHDTQVYGGHLGLTYRLGRLTLAAGFGFEHFHNDEWVGTDGYAKDSYQRRSYYLAAPWQVNQYFVVAPGVSHFDHGDDARTGKDAGSEWIAGVQFQFRF